MSNSARRMMTSPPLSRDEAQRDERGPASLLRAPNAAPTGCVTINLDQLARNWMGLADLVAPARCAAVVKANAYGLGADRVIPALVRAGCSVFFIATPQEGYEARRLAPQADIYALDGLLPGSAESFACDAIRPVLSTLADIETWARLGARLGRPLPCGLHIDSGLNRLGLTARDARRLAADGALMTGLDVRLVMSHLACADNPADPKNRDQLLAFETLTTLFPGTPRSLAASDGLMLGPAYHFDLVRPGYALYGGQASISNAAPVAPVVTVTARILAVNDVAPGESVGYAASWRASRPSRIATIAAGYADGVPRSASSSEGAACGYVLIAGHKVPIVGRVSMDLLTADVTDLPAGALAAGDDAILLGAGLTIEDAGFAAGTIGYEILTRLGARFARRHIEAGAES
jgi:alanine racemase